MENTIPLSEMTLEQLEAAKAQLVRDREALQLDVAIQQAERAEKAVTYAVSGPVEPVDGPFDDAPEESTEDDTPPPAPWPHETIELNGFILEVRRPNASALMAVSMTTTAAITNTTQLRVFTKFLTTHLSPETFDRVIEALTDPDSGLTLEGIVQALTVLAQQG